MTAGGGWEEGQRPRRLAPLVGLVLVAAVAGALLGGGAGIPDPEPAPEITVETSTESGPRVLVDEGAPQVVGEWQPTAAAPLAGRVGAASAWTGREVLIWGGVGTRAYRDGALYDPQRDTWRRVPASPLPPRYGAAAVWDGNEVVIAGGVAVARGGQPARPLRRLTDAAAYNPDTGSWNRLPRLPFEITTGRLFAHDGRLYAVRAAADRRPVAVLDHGAAMWRLLPAVAWDAAGDEVAVGRVGDDVLLWPAGRGDAVTLDLTTQAWGTVAHSATRTLASCTCELVAGSNPNGLVDIVAYDAVARQWWRRHLGPVAPSFAGGSSLQLFLVYSPGPTRALDRHGGNLFELPPEPQSLGFQPAAAWTGTQLFLWGGVSGIRMRFISDGMVFTPTG